MADELGFRFIFQDAETSSAPAEAAPVAAPRSARPSRAARATTDALEMPREIDDDFREFLQLEAYAKAAADSLGDLQTAAKDAAEAMPEKPGRAARPSQEAREQRKLEDAATSAQSKSIESIVGAFGRLPIFGQTISVLQGVAKPIIDAADAIGAMKAAEAGPTVSAPSVPVPAAAPQPVEGGGAPVPVPAGAAGSLAGLSAPVLAVGAAAAAAAAGLYAAAKAAQFADAAWTKAAQRLAPLSGELSIAQARAGVQGLLQDLRSARTVGPELAEFTSSRSSIDRSLQRIGDAISKAALEKINPLLEKVADFLESAAEYQSEIYVTTAKTAEILGGLATGDYLAAAQAIMAIEDDVRAARQEAARVNKRGDLFTVFEDIPDLHQEDEAMPGLFGMRNVSFDAVGGAELP